jgi:tetratricopeptide (TPR) repeat protein
VARALLAVAVLGAGACARRAPSAPAEAPAPTAAFIGAAACAVCHQREAAAWSGSHHQIAMQPATPSTVLGDFNEARFTRGGVESRFFQRDEKYLVWTGGPDGRRHEYQVTHTFGVAPLQQYLTSFPGGRYQALDIAWDSRQPRAGGGHWFNLHPDETIGPDDPLHWTGAAENWNFMCADCHSTNVRKGWEPAAGYQTTFAEVSVSCEACHGPGSGHVAWAHAPAGKRPRDDGLLVALDERAGVAWSTNPLNGKPQRSAPRTSEREIEMCARCHSRRGLIHEDHVHGQPVGDDYRVALLDDDLYFPDGQVKGEVYEYGSFIQSRMFAAGVTCSDCHDPHRPALGALGDNVCLRCHTAEDHATSRHHFHPQASAGARCVGCHMPAATFMVVDRRHDHSLRVPRPDLSVRLGVPNPCNGCHTDRSAAWAARTVAGWYGHSPSGSQRFAEALAAGREGSPDAPKRLAALVADHSQPAIARASALALMDPRGSPAAVEAARTALGDTSSLVRRAAAQLVADIAPEARVLLLSTLLRDPVRTVRLEAATGLADVPEDWLSLADREARETATAELVSAYHLAGDRPEAHLNLALLRARQRRFTDAKAELDRALAIDPRFTPAAVNLADLYRATGRDPDAESVLTQALEGAPRDPALQYALGLLLVRQRRLSEALPRLQAAARLGSETPRYGYVYAMALHDAGRNAEAIRALELVLGRRPYDRDASAALIEFRRDTGNQARPVR